MTVILKRENHTENCFDDTQETTIDIEPAFLPFKDCEPFNHIKTKMKQEIKKRI